MAGAYGQLDLEQKGVLQALIAYAKKEHRPNVFLEAAVFTALREQSLRNQPYGDGTSLGWRQEIEGKGTPAQRMSLAYSIPHFYRECAEIYRPGMAANVLAQLVQRPKLPYPEQEQTLALAQTYLREAPTTPPDFKFGPAPGSVGGLATSSAAPISVSTQGSVHKHDYHEKIKVTGKEASRHGSDLQAGLVNLGKLQGQLPRFP